MTRTATDIADRTDPLSALRLVLADDPGALEGATMVDVSRSHDVVTVRLRDGRAYVVKQQSTSAREGGRSLAAELFVYRLAAWLPEVAAVVPHPMLVDERRQVLVLEAAPPPHLYANHLSEKGFPGPQQARSLGAALARVHAATTDIPPIFHTNVGVLALPDASSSDQVMPSGGPAAARVADLVAEDPGLVQVLRGGAGRYRPSSLVHGDVKWDNTALAPGPPPWVTLFDWELAGIGDPAWDVGSALADGRAVPIRLGEHRPKTDRLNDGERALLTGYAGIAGPAPAGLDDFANRVAHFWVARLVHLALEAAAAIGSSEHLLVRGLLSAAVGLQRRLDDVCSQLGSALADPR